MVKKPANERISHLIFVGLFCFVSLAPRAQALTWSEDFTSSSRRDTSTLVWNTVRGELHPPLQVYQYLDGSFQDKTFSIGTGRHGAFTPSRYAEFSQGGDVTGNIIRLDTSEYPILELTTFDLAASWTLQPVGTAPLVIRVLGTVTISGHIDCSGQNGSDQNNDPTAVLSGGGGRCGGGAGGDGSTTTLAATTGLSGGTVIPNGVSPGVDGPTGGAGATGTGSGGGGGGSYAPARGVGFDPTSGAGGSGGAAGFIAADNDFDYSGGGYGGGGGSHYSAGAAGQNSAGAGGGGGGGYIFITAGSDIWISGTVSANGGDGGTGTTLAGGGGGGGGGSIALFSGGNVTLSGGTVSAMGGQGRGPAGHLGGDGAAGRTWLVGVTGYSTGGPPYETPDPSLTDVGLVRFQTGTFTALSQEFDSGNSKPTLTTVNESSVLPGGSTLTIEVASGTEAAFTPQWQNTTTLPVELQRLIRFQISINNLSLTNPGRLQSVDFELSGTSAQDFEFVSACGSVQSRSQAPPGAAEFLWTVLLMLWPFLFYRQLRWRRL